MNRLSAKATIIIEDLERRLAENARLQERVKEAERHDCGYALQRTLEIAERQMALAKVRGEELEGRFKPFLKRLIEATEPYSHENTDTSGAAELLFNIQEDAVMLRAVMTPEEASLGEKESCSTCKGTRIAPVADEDLGGKGVTMSSCSDCVGSASD